MKVKIQQKRTIRITGAEYISKENYTWVSLKSELKIRAYFRFQVLGK
jgi:hypothetical protein